MTWLMKQDNDSTSDLFLDNSFEGLKSYEVIHVGYTIIEAQGGQDFEKDYGFKIDMAECVRISYCKT